jgi:pilin isopeptide linkage protein
MAKHVDVRLIMSKIAIGSHMVGNEFSFGIFDEHGTELVTGKNDATGLITFQHLRFDDEGLFEYTAKETDAPAGWDVDTTEWPVTIEVVEEASGDLLAIVTFPNGAPVFVNTNKSAGCGKFVFPELTFQTAGTYDYTLEELTPDGGGWETDKKVVHVIVTVVDDGHGHLIATVSYPDGFPTFTNTYKACPAKVIISGCKKAVGAPLPAGRFEFGLFDDNGTLIATVTNDGPTI